MTENDVSVLEVPAAWGEFVHAIVSPYAIEGVTRYSSDFYVHIFRDDAGAIRLVTQDFKGERLLLQVIHRTP